MENKTTYFRVNSFHLIPDIKINLRASIFFAEFLDIFSFNVAAVNADDGYTGRRVSNL